jgi:uncharacterized protein (TIGR00369 family)
LNCNNYIMRKIINPFPPTLNDKYNCFGCSPENEIGLRMQFYDTGEELIAYWEPQHHYAGYPGIVHGGIQATLLDEIAAWTVYVRCETSGVTLNMNVTFHSPLRMSKGQATIKARLIEQTGKLAILKAGIFDYEGKLCSEAVMNYYIYPVEIAIKRFNYPGLQAFFEPEQ